MVPMIKATVLALVLLVAAGCGQADPGGTGEAAAPTAATATPEVTQPPAETPAEATEVTDAPTSPQQPAQPQELEQVTLRTDFAFGGYNAPYVLAEASGFYEEEGLDVAIEEGDGSGVTIQTVAAGRDDFGIADAGVVVQAISNEDVPVTMLSVYLQTTPIGFITKPGQTLEDPTDLQDKVIVSSTGDAALQLLPAVLSRYDMSMDDIEVQLVQFSARIPTFLQTDNAVLIGFQTGDYLRARAQEPDAEFLSYADLGVNSYSVGAITSDRMIEENPDLVRRFMAATTRGWQAAIEDPEAAIEAAAEAFPDTDRQLLEDGLRIALDNLLSTPATEGEVVGWTAESDWQTMLEQFQEYADMSEPQPLEEYYTNEFLPDN